MAKPDKLFPIAVRNAHNHYVMREIWLRRRPKDLIWFELDATILSLDHVAFEVYDMKDMCNGGRGAFVTTIEFELNAGECMVVKSVINEHMRTIAYGMFREARAARELAAENAERKEIYDNLTFEDY